MDLGLNTDYTNQECDCHSLADSPPMTEGRMTKNNKLNHIVDKQFPNTLANFSLFIIQHLIENR